MKFLAVSFFLAVGILARAQAPIANFSASSTSGCAPLKVTFSDISSGNPTSWNWDFGNGQLSTVQNPTVTYAIPGVYSVTLVVKNADGIDDEVKTDYITVFQSPRASFTSSLTTACVPATIQFTDQSTAPPGSSISSWLWNFGDGTTASGQNPSHTYSNTGFYTVSLQVTSNTGCKNTISISRLIRIVSGVDVDFGFSQPSTCQAPFMINLQDQSSGPGTLSYFWTFGNNTSSTLQNPSTIYPSAGTYPVKLVVISNLGCRGSISKDVVVSGKTTNFTVPATICVGQTVSLQNSSSPSPVSSSWTFSDGTTSSQINPVKTFLAGGTYQVHLINNYGNCIDSITKTITVISSPTVDFTASDSISCTSSLAVQFTDKSPGAATWLWNFGDKTTSTQQNPSHNYSTPGTYDVTLSITLPGGCANTITKSQYIKIQPTTVRISNAPAGGCIPFTYSPSAIIQSADSIVSYAWDLGEPGAIYSTKTPTHTYNSAGNFNIQLTITTQRGCVQTVNIPNGVRTGTKAAVNFSFTPNGACAATPIQFTDLSTTTPGAVVQWRWDFGDNVSTNVQNPKHTFVDTGNLLVKLTVFNNGCPAVATKPITVLPPVAKFGYKVDCANHLNVNFTDSSLASPVYGPISYQWDFGDGNTSTAKNPPHTYAALGTYTVKLTVTNGACSYPTTQTLSLFNEPVNFNVSRNTVCRFDTFTLHALPVDPANIKSFTWTIGATVLNDTSANLTYSIPNYGSYDVTLSEQDINGCVLTKTVTNYITVSGPLAKFITNGPGGCENKIISFTDQSTTTGTAIENWTWDFGDGSSQTFLGPPFSHSYAQSGSYNVSLTVRDKANCADKYAIPNAVLITNPLAGFRGDTLYCPQSPLQFVDTSIGIGLTYNWDFGDGGSSLLQNPTHSYPAAATTYTVKLKVKDLAGCEDSVTKTNYVTIRTPKAAFDVIDTAGICLPVVPSFTFKGTDYKTFHWNFGDGTTSTAQDPSHFYNNYGTYTPKLIVVGPGGCMDSAQATVHAYNPTTDTHLTTSPLVACNSLTVNFNLNAPPGIYYEFHFGDGAIDTSQQGNLTHLYPTPGNFTAFILYVDPTGCEPSVGAGVVHVYGALTLFSESKKQFCDTGTVFFKNFTLSNDRVVSTNWNFGDGGSDTAKSTTHFFSNPGTYIVTLTETTLNQCVSPYSDTVRVFQTPTVSIGAVDTICINGTENFTGILGSPDTSIQWRWNFGNGGSSQIQNPSQQYSSSGNFNVQLIAMNQLGCADTATQSVVVVPLPTAEPVSNPITITSGGSTQLNMNYTGPIVSYNWTPAQHLSCTDCPQPTASPQFTTDYHVQVQDRFGCTGAGGVTVKVICSGENFFIPNTFSPNGDGVNDVFYVRGKGLFRVNSMMIFNRWGQIVFEKKNFQVNDPLSGWDGNFKGKKATPDVYVYQVEIVCDNGEVTKYSGNIALIQ